MKTIFLICFCLTGSYLMAQPMPHGMVYGAKPNRTGVIQADKLEAFMGKRTRISTTVAGRITQVTKAKGGWFDMDAGHGQIITAHFKNYGVTIPTKLKNHYVVMEGVAQKKFIADDHQHYAGGDNNSQRKTNPKQLLMFEVKGLAVDK